MSARTCLLALTAVLTLGAGCGAEPPAADLAAAVESDAPVAEDLLACLGAAGIEARTVATTPYGVEVPVTTVVATGMESYDGAHDQGAMLYVFHDAAAAADNAAVITLGLSDDPTNDMYGVHENVVRAMSMILQPDPHTADEQALLDCLPSAQASAGVTGVTGDSLAACLTGAGLTPTVEDADADDVGIYSATARVLVDGAKTWVFPDAATRAEHTGDIWWGGLPNPKILERANTLTWLDEAPTGADPTVTALDGCLPPA